MFQNRYGTDLCREEPKVHVTVLGFVDSEETRVALNVLTLNSWQRVGNTSSTLGRPNGACIDEWGQVKGISNIPENIIGLVSWFFSNGYS